jgi:hypothetical protein
MAELITFLNKKFVDLKVEIGEEIEKKLDPKLVQFAPNFGKKFEQISNTQIDVSSIE